jgi:DNA-directed RNA polymerase specialized sigma24 family protein
MPDLGLLEDDDAVALLLAARHGLSYREIAERTGEPPAVVLSRLRRGLRHARQLNAAPSTPLEPARR